jgi:hypothetical protein
MGISPRDFDAQARVVKDAVESGMDVIEEHGGPLLDRYGRTAIVVGVSVAAALGVALLMARRRRRRTLTDRITNAIPDMGSRLEPAVSSIRSAAGRFSR